MLGKDGRLKGDLTVFNWGDGTWWVMGSYYLRQWHMRWFESFLGDGVTVQDISDIQVGFSISGPDSRKLLEKLTHQDVSHAAFPLFACRTVDVGLLRLKVARLSLSGELGFEFNCASSEHSTLRRILLEAGKEFGITEIGFNAMNSLRLEKGFGIWSREFTQGYTPGMTGMDRFIAFDKGDFVGKEAATREKADNSAARVLVTIGVDADDADASGYEPIWNDGKFVGFVTSGGYGYTIGKSIALALVDRELSSEGTELTVHVVGQERKAVVLPSSPYDPSGSLMRT